jgi:hypothetical protein
VLLLRKPVQAVGVLASIPDVHGVRISAKAPTVRNILRGFIQTLHPKYRDTDAN